MIRLQQVSKRFGPVTALDGMTWQAPAGQVTCVLGPNGAGKTTAVEVAEGLLRPDSGEVEGLGRQPWRACPEHRARVGVMLQDGGLPQAVPALRLLRHLARLYTAPADVEELA
ncbi:ATP-binding cassette domain-containing protein, partial [Ornithinicoccus halotolerans]|uniref:ATP-binding cassette domain-containing protein n=1 Tax=Ornithinicoccus halotolerans TaxID=1748220 RepID=UPI001E522469